MSPLVLEPGLPLELELEVVPPSSLLLHATTRITDPTKTTGTQEKGFISP